MKWELTDLTQDGWPVYFDVATGDLAVEHGDRLVECQAATLEAWAEVRHDLGSASLTDTRIVGLAKR